MPSGLAALLDDIAGITKLAAASLDDVGAAAGKAGTKAVGVVVDDTAVTPGYAAVPPARRPDPQRLRALGGDADPDVRRRLSGLRGHREDHRGLHAP
jgi:hypothetical protein